MYEPNVTDLSTSNNRMKDRAFFELFDVPVSNISVMNNPQNSTSDSKCRILESIA